MGEPFIGEIRMFSFNFAPIDWALCNGATMQIKQNQALYSLLGTHYGGDGSTTFKLPDLRGRVPLDSGTLWGGSTYSIGALGGMETVTLAQTEMPAHNHNLIACVNPADQKSGKDHLLAQPASPHPIYNQESQDENTLNALIDKSLSTVGVGLAHGNLQPFLVINFCISLRGIYPQRT